MYAILEIKSCAGNQIGGRQLLVFCLFVFCNILSVAQPKEHPVISYQKSISTGKNSITNQISSFVFPPYAYYFTSEEWNTESRVLKIYSVNCETGFRDSIEINIPRVIIINELPTIAVNENYLILCDDENFSFYRYLNRNGKYTFSNKIKLPNNSSGRYIRIIDKDKFLIHTIYNFHPDAESYNSNIGIYDAKNDKFINFIHPDLPCIGFSHLPKSWVTFNEKLIAIADPCGYKIRFYDFGLNLYDSINYFPGNGWKNLNGNKIPLETNPAKIHPKLLIDQLLSLQDSISRIEKIYFIDNSKLLVSSISPKCGKEKRRIDIWGTSNLKKPMLTETDFPVSYFDNDTIDRNDCPFPYYHLSEFTLNNNLIFTITDENLNQTLPITMKEFKTLKDLYYEKNDPEFSIDIYKINFR